MSRCLIAAVLLASWGTLFAEDGEQDRPNILFIAIDDLRPELGSYGSEIAVTPNLDALAATGLQFNNAHVQQAICGPSRASIMTGLRPDTIGVTHNYTLFRENLPDVVTIPQHFRNNGYETVYVGKVFHGQDTDEKLSWSRDPASRQSIPGLEKPLVYGLAENRELAARNKAEMMAKYGDQARFGLGRGPAFEAADVPDNHFVDGYNTDIAIKTLQDMSADRTGKPFFLALGFKKPHLDWVCPKKYWDLYDRSEMKPPKQVSAPMGSAEMGLHPSFELRVRHGIPKLGPMGPELSATLKQAYMACVSYVDAQIGRMLSALDESGLRDNTIVIVWSDHGWHLGEMGIWGKATNYEIATRVPLMIWTADMPDEHRGRQTDALVELIDIFPTLSDLSGLDAPSQLDGRSFVPLLGDPDLDWKQAAFSQFPSPALREWGSIPLRPAMRETFFGPLIEEVEARIKVQQQDKWDRDLFETYLMGYSVRTDVYRMTAWIDTRNPEREPLFVELYEYDGDVVESINIADENPNVVARLLGLLRSQSH